MLAALRNGGIFHIGGLVAGAVNGNFVSCEEIVPHGVLKVAGAGGIQYTQRFVSALHGAAVSQGVDEGSGGGVMAVQHLLGVSHGKGGYEGNGFAVGNAVVRIVTTQIQSAVVVIHGAVAQLVGGGAGIVGVTHGGLAVGHNHHNGHTAHTCLHAFGDLGVGIQQQVHSFKYAVLHKGAGGGVHGLGNGLTLGVFDAAVQPQGVIPVVAHGGGFQEGVVGGGVAPQGQQHLHIAVAGVKLTVNVAGISHNGDTVVVVQLQKAGDGVVGSQRQVVHGGVVAADAAACACAAHGGTKVQHQHGVCGDGGVALDLLVGGNGGQGD